MKAKKRLGQNFLHDKNILQKIIEAGEVSKEDLVIEVGAGRGALTEELVKHAGHVKALEIDDDLIPILQNKFKNVKNLEIIHEDVLKYNINDTPRRDADLSRLETNSPSRLNSGRLNLRRLKVIANIPYYITSPIIRHFLHPQTHETHKTPETPETHQKPSLMVLLIQKEVAQKIISEKGSVLSLIIKAFTDPKIICTVPRTAFIPQPKVESAVLKLTTLDQPKINCDFEKFLKLIKLAFAQPRKTLANNLSPLVKGGSPEWGRGVKDKEELEKIITSLNLDPKIRAEKLSFEEWEKLLEKLEN